MNNMKHLERSTIVIKAILVVVLTTMAISGLKSQVNYYQTTLSGSYPSAIGISTKALGNYSFAAGGFSQATSSYSIALGFYSFATYSKAIAIGSAVKSNVYKSIVIGSGSYDHGKYLENNVMESLMVGFNSKYPTLFVVQPEEQDLNYTKTGKIGIGNVTSPLAKLHLRADEGEDAAIYVQPHNWLEGDGAGLALGDMSHGISAMKDKGLIFNTSSSYNFNGGLIKYGMDAREGSVLLCTDSEGTAVWAQLEMPAPSPWLTSGTNDIYFSAGKVGIGTINTYGYELAVLGKILADEVMIKHPVDWGDYVFKPEYKLMPVNELAAFVKLNSHLPGVPSEKEVSENGYGLAQMNEILLKKVEELTLYIIQQQEMLQKQQEISQKQQDEINNLKEVIY